MRPENFAEGYHVVAYQTEKDGEWIKHEYIACYASVTYSNAPIHGISTYFSPKLYWPEHYLRSVVEHEVFSKVVLTKDIEEAKEYGFQFNLEMPAPVVVAAMQTLRAPFEFQCAEYIDKLSKYGATVYECILFTLFLDKNGYKDYANNSNHTPFGEKVSLKQTHTHSWVDRAVKRYFPINGGIKYGQVGSMFYNGQYGNNYLKDMFFKGDKVTDIFGHVSYSTGLNEDKIKPQLELMRKELGYAV